MMPNDRQHWQVLESRRTFFAKSGIGLGSLAAASLDQPAQTSAGAIDPGNPKLEALRPRLAPGRARAKNIIYLFMIGGPSHLDLFDYKPALDRYDGQPMPDSYVDKVRFEQIKDKQPLLMKSPWKFRKCGQTGRYVSEFLPQTQNIIDELAFVRTLSTDESVHPHAELLLLTGHRIAGRPSLGSWVIYGLGTESRDLPGFVVLGNSSPRSKAGIYSNGFLSSVYHGVPFRGRGSPILNLKNPPGVSPAEGRYVVDAVNQLNARHYQQKGDSEIAARMSAYELAFRMQTSAPKLVDLNDEPAHVLKMYGVDPTNPQQPSFARECLLARRLVERGVRFVQVNFGDWDHHGNIEVAFPPMARVMDRPMAALVQDLRQRGLLDDTLVVWGGEFGRTPVAQPQKNIPVGRDHLIESFTIWMAGGGVQPGAEIGATDELGFAATKDPVHVHDLQATLLHLLGLDHTQLIYHHQGRDFRLTDVYGNVIEGLFAS